MAITKILNIMESEGRNPASHLKNALEYIQNPDKTEECVLVGGINCLPDTAFEQMEETKNIFHKTGKRQGYHVIISFSPEEKVTAEQAMYVLEHFAKDVLSDDYEAVYAVHTDRAGTACPMERDCESKLSKLNIEQNACIYHFGASVIHGQRSNILRLL